MNKTEIVMFIDEILNYLDENKIDYPLEWENTRDKIAGFNDWFNGLKKEEKND